MRSLMTHFWFHTNKYADQHKITKTYKNIRQPCTSFIIPRFRRLMCITAFPCFFPIAGFKFKTDETGPITQEFDCFKGNIGKTCETRWRALYHVTRSHESGLEAILSLLKYWNRKKKCKKCRLIWYQNQACISEGETGVVS